MEPKIHSSFMLNNYFYFFFLLIIFSGFFVIISKNPIHSVYFLILVFLFSSILFIILGAEFLAVLVIIIYVGAISILFLFVVMMLNLRIMELYSSFFNYLPIGSLIGLFFCFEFTYAVSLDFNFFKVNSYINQPFFEIVSIVYYNGNAAYLGWVLYNFYNHLVLIASFILLISMIGSIVLTVDFEYRASRKKEFYVLVKRDISTVSFWNSQKIN